MSDESSFDFDMKRKRLRVHFVLYDHRPSVARQLCAYLGTLWNSFKYIFDEKKPFRTHVRSISSQISAVHFPSSRIVIIGIFLFIFYSDFFYKNIFNYENYYASINILQTMKWFIVWNSLRCNGNWQENKIKKRLRRKWINVYCHNFLYVQFLRTIHFYFLLFVFIRPPLNLMHDGLSTDHHLTMDARLKKKNWRK